MNHKNLYSLLITFLLLFYALLALGQTDFEVNLHKAKVCLDQKEISFSETKLYLQDALTHAASKSDTAAVFISTSHFYKAKGSIDSARIFLLGALELEKQMPLTDSLYLDLMQGLIYEEAMPYKEWKSFLKQEQADLAKRPVQDSFKVALKLQSLYVFGLGSWENRLEEAVDYSKAIVSDLIDVRGESCKELAEWYGHIGHYYGSLFEVDSSLKYEYLEMEMIERYMPEDLEQIGYGHYDISYVLVDKGEYRKAIIHGLKAYRAWEKMDFKGIDYLSSWFYNIGYCFRRLNNHQAEELSYKMALDHVSDKPYGELYLDSLSKVLVLYGFYIRNGQEKEAENWQPLLEKLLERAPKTHYAHPFYNIYRYNYIYDLPESIYGLPVITDSLDTRLAYRLRYIQEVIDFYKDMHPSHPSRLIAEMDRNHADLFYHRNYQKALDELDALVTEFPDILIHESSSRNYYILKAYLLRNLARDNELFALWDSAFDSERLAKENTDYLDELKLNASTLHLLSLRLRDMLNHTERFNSELLDVNIDNFYRFASWLVAQSPLDKSTNQNTLASTTYSVIKYHIQSGKPLGQILNRLYFLKQDVELHSIFSNKYQKDPKIITGLILKNKRLRSRYERNPNQILKQQMQENNLRIIEHTIQTPSKHEKSPDEFYLEEDAIAIDFLETKESVLVLYYDQDKLIHHTSVPTDSFLLLAEEFRTSIVDIASYDFDKERQKEAFLRSGYNLYQSVIQPIKEIKKGSKLIFLGHGMSAHTPWHLLVQAQNPQLGYADQPYIFLEHYIQYRTQPTLRESLTPNSGVLVVAPNFEDHSSIAVVDVQRNLDDDYSDLPGAKKEAAFLTEEYHAQTIEGKSATIPIFEREASNYGLLHLATHGYVDADQPEFSALLMQEDSVYSGYLDINLLSSMKLNASLAVLSACNTGYSEKLVSGIGSQYIGKAFEQAGVQSIVMTLWKSSDAFSPIFMKEFYRHLDGDHSVSEALGLAQRSILSDSELSDFHHPMYWGAFVLLGQDEVITVRHSSSWVYLVLIAGVILALFGAFLLFKKVETAARSSSDE